MTEEKLSRGNVLLQEVRYNQNKINDLERMISFDKMIVKIPNYSIEATIPVDLRQPVIDMISKYYERRRDEAQAEFDAI